MNARWNAWRRRQHSRVLYVPAQFDHATITAAGLRAARSVRHVRMIEVVDASAHNREQRP